MTTPSLRRAPARALLKDRVLVLGVGSDVRSLAAEIDQTVSGVVAVGADANEAIRVLRAAYPDLVLLRDPGVHVTRLATSAAPFPFADPDHQDALFAIEQTLEDYLNAQLANGASAAVFPTGFLAAGDHASMTAVIKVANSFDRGDLILHLPLSYKWLSSAGDLHKLIAGVHRSRHPVAISMAHKSNPASQRGVVDGIHELLAAAPANVTLWHTDLGALDALANGALGGAVGITSTHRHILGPDEIAHSPSKGTDRTPNVLLPDHLRFKKSQQMTRDWFANGGDPSCLCPVCGGRTVARFGTSTADKLEAHRHNLDHVTRIHKQLLAAAYRQLRWAELLADAETAHLATATATGVMGIKPDAELKQWIKLNPLPRAT